MISATVQYDYPAVPLNEQFTMRVMLGVAGDRAETVAIPLNLGLVLDKSGSMSGSKLSKALESVKMIAGMLKGDEHLTIAVFDSRAELILPATKGSELKDIEQLLSSIAAGSNTNMGSGYKLAYEQLLAVMGMNVSRLAILSDGMVNEGLNNRQLCAKAEDYQRQGISTTTFGVGDDFDELLMTEMAQNGGGTAYFIDQPSDSVAVFREELDALRNLAAPHCSVTFIPKQDGIRCTQLNSYQAPTATSWMLGDISSAETRNLVLEFELPGFTQAGEQLLGELQITWKELANGSADTDKSLTIPVVVKSVTLEQFNEIKPDDAVTIEAALLTIARGKRTARDMGRDRKYDEAAELLETIATQIEGLELEDSQLAKELEDIRERATRLRNERERFMSAREQKSMMYESDLMSKGKRSSYMSHKERYIRDNMARRNDGSDIMVVYREVTGRGRLGTAIPAAGRTVNQFLVDLAEVMGEDSYRKSYGRDWLLQDEATNRVFDIGPGWAEAQGKADDDRNITLSGMLPGRSLRALPIDPPVSGRLMVPDNLMLLDLAPLLKTANLPVQEQYDPDQPACDFLAKIYYLISSVVRPNTYGSSWVLREVDTCRIFDVGSAWARSMGILADTRPLAAVGIRGGTTIQIVNLMPDTD